ncbi:hypothetical protein GGR52DRAFT_322585 [Hypoxylon sp. FL1284]|nr:hypothetical protein GGR52DRAFT_322585 [Hypoxylon sp. FL1284]
MHQESSYSSSVSVSAPSSRRGDFSAQDLQILHQAASVLNCQLSQLLDLDNRSPHLQQYPASSPSYSNPSKRQRLSTDMASSSQEKSFSSPSAHDTPGRPHAPEASGSGFFLGMERSRLAQYLSSVSFCAPCTTCEPQAYAPIPATSPYSYVPPRQYFDDRPSSPVPVPGSLHSGQPDVFASGVPSTAPPMMPNYPLLQPNQPTTIQPTTSGEGMVYLEPLAGQQFPGQQDFHRGLANPVSSHGMGPQSYGPPASRQNSVNGGIFPQPCETNPDDKQGTCLTCLNLKTSNAKPGNVKGYEWTRRWVEGIPDDISQWASVETRKVRVTEGYTQQAVELRVRQFVPQDGDRLDRSWFHNGTQRRVRIPPYAIVNLDEAKATYNNYIQQCLGECCKKVLAGKDRLLLVTYGMAIRASNSPSLDPKESALLRKALQLWMAIRLTTKSTIIVGEETLGMPRDIMDETSPQKGCIPLPPVMGAQIELILIHQIQVNLRREMLENLQSMTQANKHKTWFTTYLVTFILLHNVALLCQHDASYARKHGIKSRFAREEMVREYQMGVHPFSPSCKDKELKSLAELDDIEMRTIQQTKTCAERYKKYWEKIRQSGDYENDFYYISQLYETNWTPQSTI